jgi:predicted nucleic-acid-binding protein
VLHGVYGYRREKIVGPLKMLLKTAEFRIEDPDSAWGAVRLYETARCDFADGYLSRTNRNAGCVSTVTFDRKASRLDDFEGL